MPIVFHLQSNFTAGELDENLHARVDFKGYSNAAAKLRNVLVIPQGGLKRRFGLKFTTEIFDIENSDQFKFVLLEFNLSPQYLMLFTPLRIRVFLVDDDKQTTEIFELASPYKADEIKDLKFTQSSNVLLIFHENHIPSLLRRIQLIPGGWNATTNVPLLVSGVGATDALYEVTVAGNTILDGNGDWLVGQGVFFTGGAWTKLFIPLDITVPWQLIPASFRYFPTFDFKQNYDTAIFIPNAIGGFDETINIKNPLGTAFRFTPELIGGIFIGNGGTCRIKALGPFPPPPPASEQIIVDIIQPFLGNGDLNPGPIAIEGKNVLITEPAFSDTLGWPKSGTFFQGRLWLGGSRSLPAGVFGSTVNDFFNFDDTQGVDSDGIFVFINSTKANIIRYVIGTQSLVVFTSDGEFSTQVILEDAVTPSNMSLLQQSKNGTADVEPIVIDDQVIFVDRSGKIVRNLIYDSQRGSYTAINISILSAQLIDNPTSSAVYKGNTADDSVYLFLVNQKEGSVIDGTIAAYQTLLSQDVSAWTLLTTDGKFKQTTGASNNAFFLVERENKFYVEQLDFDLFVDAATVKNNPIPTNLVTDLAYLNNRVVRVIADGVILSPTPEFPLQVIGNVLQLPFAATNVTVGLDFTPLIETLPININTQTGPNLYLAKKITRVFVDFFESLGIEVNGIILKDLEFSATEFNAPPPPRTGFDSLFISPGYESNKQIVTITQSLPLPMTIRGISMEVDINE